MPSTLDPALTTPDSAVNDAMFTENGCSLLDYVLRRSWRGQSAHSDGYYVRSNVTITHEEGSSCYIIIVEFQTHLINFELTLVSNHDMQYNCSQDLYKCSFIGF